MSRAAEAKIRISAEDKASKEVQKAETSFTKFGRALSIGFAAATAAAGAALIKLSEAFDKSVEAAAQQQEALKGVETSLRSIGQATPQAVQGFADWASVLQQATTVGDETILSLSRLAISFTKNAEQAQKLTETALNFAEGAGISYEEAVRRLGRTLGGSAADVANFDSRVRDLTKTQLANGEAIDLLAESYAGFAAAAADTYAGALKQLENAQGDVAESIGAIKTANEGLIGVIKQRTSAAVELQRVLNQENQGAENAATFIERLKLRYDEFKIGLALTANQLLGLGSAATQATRAFESDLNPALLATDEALDDVNEAISDFVSESELAERASREFEAAILSNLEALSDETESIRRAEEAQRDLDERRGITAEETEKAKEKQDQYNESVEDGTEEVDRFVSAQRRVQDALRGTQQVLAQTTAAFDALVSSQGRAAATEAALAGGATQSGNRIFFPGGGSRFVTDPGFSGGLSGRNAGGGLSPSRSGSYSNL